jgi:hypothetical protein
MLKTSVLDTVFDAVFLVGNPWMTKITCQRSRKEKNRLEIESLMTCCPVTPRSCSSPLRPQAQAKTKSFIQEDRKRGNKQYGESCTTSELHSPLAIHFYLNSRVVMFSDARGEQWKWTPLTEITITYWIKLLFAAIIWNLLRAENQFFCHLKYSFCRLLDSAARGGSAIRPTLTTPLYLNIGYIKTTINEILVQATVHKIWA